MGIHEHDVHTKTDILIAAVQELTGEIRRLAELIEDALPDDAPADDADDD